MSSSQSPAKDKAASTSGEKENFTLFIAAIGPDLINAAVFKKMAALNPEGKSASAWEHFFRGLKVKAKEMVKEMEGASASAAEDENVSTAIHSWATLKMNEALEVENGGSVDNLFL